MIIRFYRKHLLLMSLHYRRNLLYNPHKSLIIFRKRSSSESAVALGYGRVQFFTVGIESRCSRRERFACDSTTMIETALESLRISEIPNHDDDAMSRLITVVLSCECILNGPLPLSDNQRRRFEESIQSLASKHPRSQTISDYPKAVEFWSMIDKMKNDVQLFHSQNNIHSLIDEGKE